MHFRRETTGLAALAVLVLLVATLCVMQASRWVVCHAQDAPAPVCMHVDSGDLDDIQVERVSAAVTQPLRFPHASAHTGVPGLLLSPNIFQPPEAA